MICLEYDYGDWLIKLSPKDTKIGMEYCDSDDQQIIHEKIHLVDLESAIVYIRREYKEGYESLVKNGCISYEQAVKTVYPEITGYGFRAA